MILLDSFGIDMHAKLREEIDKTLKGKASYRVKAGRLNLTWPILKAQLGDTRLPGKLAKIPELMAGDPARPESFKLAVEYY